MCPTRTLRAFAGHFRAGLFKARRLEILASVVLFILHPSLYIYGRDVLFGLSAYYGSTDDRLFTTIWGSPFTILAAIFNRETPMHTDPGSPHGWLDVIFTLGPYRSTIMKCDSLGVYFDYPPGTVVAMSCNIIRHGVAATSETEERTSLIFYFKEWAGVFVRHQFPASMVDFPGPSYFTSSS